MVSVRADPFWRSVAEAAYLAITLPHSLLLHVWAHGWTVPQYMHIISFVAWRSIWCVSCSS